MFSLESLILQASIGPGAGITFLSSFLGLFAAMGLLLLSILTWPIRVLILLIKLVRLKLKPVASRVVIVGLDGLDPGRVLRLMSEGRSPNFQRLTETGTFSDLAIGFRLPPANQVETKNVWKISPFCQQKSQP